jgi:hypothetical protein
MTAIDPLRPQDANARLAALADLADLPAELDAAIRDDDARQGMQPHDMATPPVSLRGLPKENYYILCDHRWSGASRIARQLPAERVELARFGIAYPGAVGVALETVYFGQCRRCRRWHWGAAWLPILSDPRRV